MNHKKLSFLFFISIEKIYTFLIQAKMADFFALYRII
ncbi:hypothetical protein CBUD_A0030a (plasmid) [Coxiella burnetii Dugway 5J108-111]|uniref:Uncharacterized protein n=1 Tax=Coxiella burnetii (strain Dugway 5J108-111) TaxID=434922 RepID=B5XHS7_COXBN|nr:hypothetical protein CBUD_A0030a [Coxiella burnetii Dugway 5J108-111]